MGIDNELAFILFIKSLGSMLQETEGIILHHNDTAYAVFKADGKIRILQDDMYLNYPDGNMLWMHDEPVGNA